MHRVGTTQDNVLGHTYETTDGPEESVLLNAVAIVDVTIFLDLPSHAVKLLMTRIIPEMKRNNVFWYYESTNSHDRAAIAALKRAEILFSTDDTGYYIVNPFKLRRGKPMRAVAASLAMLSKSNGITSPLEDLRAPKRALLN